MSVLERVNILTENERSTITAHGIKLTEVSRLIPMKVAMHRLNKYNWLQIAINVEASNVFWSSLRDELMKYVAEKSMSQSTIHTIFSTIRKFISNAFPAYATEAKTYIVACFPKEPTCNQESRKKQMLSQELKRLITLRTNQKSEASIMKTVKTFEALTNHLQFDESVDTMDVANGNDIVVELVQNMNDEEDEVITYIQTLHKDVVARIFTLCSKVLPNVSQTLIRAIQETSLEKKADANVSSRESPLDKDIDQQRFSCDEVDAMAAKCKTTRDQLLFYLLFTTGLRASGLAKIKVDHVAAYDNGWTVHTFGKTVEKGNKIRTFPLNGKVKQLILLWLSSERKNTNTPYLFPGQYEGTHMAANYIWAVFNRIAIEADIPKVRAHPHAARHTVAFLMAEQGVDMDSLARFLGHASGKTTEKYYVKYAAHENVAKMQIPWLQDIKPMNATQVPTCLIQPKSSTSDAESHKRHGEKREKKDKKIRKTLNTIMSMQKAMLE